MNNITQMIDTDTFYQTMNYQITKIILFFISTYSITLIQLKFPEQKRKLK